MSIKNIALAGAASALIFSSLASMAFASTVPTNFPGNTGTSCNAWHGAPGGLGINSPYYWVQNDPGFGQEQGVNTGQQNAGLSASCNQ